jgi:prepilin-type N-terminal cleavage/methylation domain-containing protein
VAQLRHRGFCERGFTLPEVMIVIVIMGILTAIAVPTWWSVVEGRQVDSATNQLAADLRLAHTSATNRLGTAQIRFSSTGSASFTCGATAADYCLVRPVAGGGTESIARNFEDNVVLNSPNLLPVGGMSAVEFSSNGSASAVGMPGTVPGVVDNCPSSTPVGRRLQVTVDGNPAHCVTFSEATSRIKID